MAHDRRMSLLRLEEGLEQRIPLAAHDVNKRHLWQLSPIEEDRVVKKQKEDRVVKKQDNDDNDVNQEQRNSPWMKLPPFPFAAWRKLTKKEWKDYNKCLEKSEKKKYQFVKVLKANVRLRRGFLYHITFQAEDITGSGSPPLNFRAIVHSLQGRKTVEFCELQL